MRLLNRMLTRLLSFSTMEGAMMNWNKEPIPVSVALQIGWNLPMDVVGAGVYGGIVKRDSDGKVVPGDEWPEDNRAPPAHNPVHTTGPYLDFSKLTDTNRGYSYIAQLLQEGSAEKLEGLFASLGSDEEMPVLKLKSTSCMCERSPI